MTGTERKCFQKHYPPDFDPSKLKKAKKRSAEIKQRVMVPFNVRCDTCAEYIYKGRKFNMLRETAVGEEFLGIKKVRLVFNCPNCLAEIAFKTDPEHANYELESGATQLFEAARLAREQEDEERMREEEEANDPMKMMEKRAKASLTEMEATERLEELQESNRRSAAVDPLDVLKSAENAQKLDQEREDDAWICDAMKKRREGSEEEESPGSGGLRKAAAESKQRRLLKGAIVKKKRRKLDEEDNKAALSSICVYSDSDSD